METVSDIAACLPPACRLVDSFCSGDDIPAAHRGSCSGHVPPVPSRRRTTYEVARAAVTSFGHAASADRALEAAAALSRAIAACSVRADSPEGMPSRRPISR
jgi:hypothetical protein